MSSIGIWTGISKHKMFNILRSKERLILKLGQLREYCLKNMFMQKACRKCSTELLPDYYLVLVNVLKWSQCIQANYYEKEETLKKNYQKFYLVTHLFSGYQICPEMRLSFFNDSSVFIL